MWPVFGAIPLLQQEGKLRQVSLHFQQPGSAEIVSIERCKDHLQSGMLTVEEGPGRRYRDRLALIYVVH